MASEDPGNLWAWLAEQEQARGKAVRLRAVFNGDTDGRTPVTLILRGGQPMVELSPEARALFDRIDAQSIASRYVDQAKGAVWIKRFNEARQQDLLSPNAVCRLLLGPYYRPGRTIYAFNANVELRIHHHDVAEWFPDVDPADMAWPSLSDLAELLRGEDDDGTATSTIHAGSSPAVAFSSEATGGGAGRTDANRVALKAIRSVLEAARPFELDVEGKKVSVTVERLPSEPWPKGGLTGLDLAADGPLPCAVRTICRWEGGEAGVIVSAALPGTGTYRHLLSVQARAFGKQVVWSNLAVTLRNANDGAAVPISGWCALFTQKDEATPEDRGAKSRALKTVVGRSGLPLLSTSRVRLFDVEVPSGEVQPSPEEAFRRIVHLTLLKLPFFVHEGVDGQVSSSLINVGAIEPAEHESDTEAPAAGAAEKLAALYPLPGGVRQYKATLDAILGWFAEEARTGSDVLEMLKGRYEVTGPVAVKGYVRLLENLDFVSEGPGGSLELTDAGRTYLDHPHPELLFDRLERTFSGVLETLVITGELGTANPVSTKRILEDVLEADWKSPNQTAFRRNWLLSLGLTDRKARGDVLTDRGRDVLSSHAAAAEPIRADVVAILTEEPELAVPVESEDEAPIDDEGPAVAAGTTAAPARPSAAPASWDADRLDLTASILDEHLAGLRMPAAVLEQACAALSAGKHLLLVGPPGNGKTKLALALAAAARAENYCQGAFLATASADWTTFDTIGGYALEKNGALRFRPGVFLAAVERWQWLLIDELNRADVDRAFGELMTVLAGGTSDTAYQLPDERTVSIGSRANCSHRLPRTFRVLATMNTWDKTSLFRLSYAVQRRFAIIHVGIPDDMTYGALIDHHADRVGFDQPLEDGAKGPLKALFQEKGLLSVRQIGPAILEDIVAYMRRRRGSGDALAEAVGMYLLPQLEGLEQEHASLVFRKIQDALAGWTSADALVVLRGQYREIFPHLKLPEA